MNKTPSFKRSFASSLASSYTIQFSIMFISYFAQMFIARYLLDRDFGLFAEAIFVNLLLSNIVNLNFGKHLIRTDYSKWGNAILIQLFILLPIIGLFFFKPEIIGFFDPLLAPVIRIFIFNLFFITVSSLFNTYLLKEMKLHGMIIPQILSTTLYVFLVIFLGMKGYGVWALIYGTMASEILKSLYLIVVFGKPLFNKLKFTLAYTKELIIGTAYLFFILLVGNLYNQVHIALLGKLLDASFVGAFYLAYRFVQLPEKMISKAFRQVLYPAYSSNAENKPRVQKILKYSTLLVVAVEVFIYTFLFIYADFIIRIVYGPTKMHIVPLFRFLCFIPIVFPYGKYTESILVAYKYEKWNFYGLVFNLIMTIALGMFLIPKFNNYGMGILRYISTFFALIPIYFTVKKIGFRVFFKEYFLVYSPILVAITAFFSRTVRLYALPLILLYFTFIFIVEYKLMWREFLNLASVKERLKRFRNKKDDQASK